MRRIYLASDIIVVNNKNKLHGLPMRRRIHVNVLAAKRLDTERVPDEAPKIVDCYAKEHNFFRVVKSF